MDEDAKQNGKRQSPHFHAATNICWQNQDIIYNFRAQLQGTGSRSDFSYE